MAYKTVARNLNGKAVIYVGPGGKDYPNGSDMVVVRFEDRQFTLRAGYWVTLPAWNGPFGVVLGTGSQANVECYGRPASAAAKTLVARRLEVV